MEANMLGSTLRGRSTGSESSRGLMGRRTRESGRSIRCTGGGYSGGQMEGGTRGSTKMIRNMEEDILRIQTEKEKRGYGSMGSILEGRT